MSSHHDLPSILLVDDEEDFLDLAKGLLERAGVSHPLVLLQGGQQAIDYLKQCCESGNSFDKPALILLDIAMPVVNGFEVLRSVRSTEALRAVKVAMLTSSADPRDQQHATDLGADAYVVKFPSALVLGALVRTALGQHNQHANSSGS